MEETVRLPETPDTDTVLTFCDDCNGNLVTDGARTLVWDAFNRPASIRSTGSGLTQFTYTGDGARFEKSGSTDTIRYL